MCTILYLYLDIHTFICVHELYVYSSLFTIRFYRLKFLRRILVSLRITKYGNTMNKTWFLQDLVHTHRLHRLLNLILVFTKKEVTLQASFWKSRPKSKLKNLRFVKIKV